MRITVHADDLGLCARTTEKILEAHARGYLDRVGIIPNGEAFPLAALCLRRNGLRWSAHLNLAEGRSLSRADQVPMLVDTRGFFRRSFLGLWLLYSLRRKHRAQLLTEIEQELEAQLMMVRNAFPGKPITVDSHQHFHMLPFIYRILVRNAGTWGISAIRIVHEPLLLPPLTRQGLSCLFSTNLLKHVVLRLLSRRCVRASKESGIAHPDYLVGALFSGKMSLQIVRRAVRAIAARDPEGNPEVELVFHPCRIDPPEMKGWNAGPRKKRFYLSSDRTREMQTLVSKDFRGFLARFKEAGW